jgi:hypothetical protein
MSDAYQCHTLLHIAIYCHDDYYDKEHSSEPLQSLGGFPYGKINEKEIS